MPFFVIFVIIPLIELMLFLTVSEHVGLLTTLLMAVFTAVLGGVIVRHQGLQTILQIREAMNAGKIPLSEIFDGFCLVAAGATLITPGFLTDTIGFILLIPFFRQFLRSLIKNHTTWHSEVHHFNRSKRYNDPHVIEGEYENLNDKD